VLGYLPPSLWTRLFACSNWVESQDLLMTFLQALGGRALTEPTYKCIASLSMVVTDPNARMLPCSVKQRCYLALKTEFKKRVRQMAKPQVWIEQLPPAPSDFKRSHPALYANVFGDEAPVAAQVDLAQLIAVDSTFRCRGEKAHQGQTPAQGQAADCTIQLMSQMMALQQQNLQLVMRASAPVHAARGLSSMQALSQSPAPLRRAFTVTEGFESQGSHQLQFAEGSPPTPAAHDQLALPAPSELAVAPPTAAAESQPPLAESPLSLAAQGQLAQLPAAAPAQPLVAQLLDDYLHMQGGIRGAKKQRVQRVLALTDQAGAGPSQAPAPGSSAGPSQAAGGPSQASAPDAKVVTPKETAAPASLPAMPSQAPAPGASAPMTVTSETASRPASVQHQRTRFNYVVRLGFGRGSTQSFPYKAGDKASQDNAHGLAKEFLKDALTTKA
jgi:hypothetical protein